MNKNKEKGFFRIRFNKYKPFLIISVVAFIKLIIFLILIFTISFNKTIALTLVVIAIIDLLFVVFYSKFYSRSDKQKVSISSEFFRANPLIEHDIFFYSSKEFEFKTSNIKNISIFEYVNLEITFFDEEIFTENKVILQNVQNILEVKEKIENLVLESKKVNNDDTIKK